MLFPEDGSLPRITRSGLSPFNNVMIVKVPEQFRKPGETIFQLATLDPSKKTERWPADKFIYKNSVSEEIEVPNCNESDSNKEKESEKSKFEIEVQKSLFALEKQRLKEKLSSALNPEHDKKVSPNLKKYENHKEFKNQTAKNHQEGRKSFTAKTFPDNRGFRNRDYNEGKSHDARYHHKRAMHIEPWINPPPEYVNTVYGKKTPVNELKNHTLDLRRQQNEVSCFYEAGDERTFAHLPGSRLNDKIPNTNLSDASHSDCMLYPEQPHMNRNWRRSQKVKRPLLTTPPFESFDKHPQRNPAKTGYFEPNRNIPEKPNFPPRRDRYIEGTLDFDNTYHSGYDAPPGFQYRNQYNNIPGAESNLVTDRNYGRSNRDEPNFHRNHIKDPNLKAVPFSNNLNGMDSYRNDVFHGPYPIPERRYEENSSKDPDFRKLGREKDFRPRNQNNRRDGRGRNSFRGSRGGVDQWRRHRRGQWKDRFQKNAPDK